MGAILSTLLLIGALVLILKLAVSPDRRFLTRRLFPKEDRGFREPGPGMPWHRGAALAALATVPMAELAAQADTGPGFMGIAGIGAAAAVAFRWLPGLTGAALGIVGSLFAVIGVFTPVCTDPGGLRAGTVILVVLLGLAAFFVTAAVRISAIFVLIRTSPGSLGLAMFGVIDLGILVGGPFGLELTELAGLGGTLVVIVALYILICAGAGLLPELTTSVLGAALLSAHVTVDLVIGDPCSERFGVLAATLIGFVAAWTVANRLRR